MKTHTKTEQILMTMPILAWVAFIAYLIEAGAILIAFITSCLNPAGAINFYRGLDLSHLYQFNFWYFTLYATLMITFSVLKAAVALLVIRTLSKFNLENPFTMEVARRLEKISYVAFASWAAAMLLNALMGWLLKITGEIHGNWISGEFIFIIALVYIISQVFKRGVEIQTENELTV